MAMDELPSVGTGLSISIERSPSTPVTTPLKGGFLGPSFINSDGKSTISTLVPLNPRTIGKVGKAAKSPSCSYT